MTLERERLLTLVGLIITGSVFSAFLYLNVSHSIELYTTQQTNAALETILFIFISTFLIYSNFIYLLTRYGRLKRDEEFEEEPQRFLAEFAFGAKPPPQLTILVPAFKEDISVITMALLSCTFQEYPCKRIVLLIDNPPDPQSPNDKKLLDASRKLPEYIATMLKPMHSIITKEWIQFESRKHQMNRAEAARVRTALYRDVATWFENMSREYYTHDHIEHCFVKEILSKLASKCHSQAESLEYKAQQESASVNEIEYGYRYLHSLFSAELVSFERKTFENLSHEPNKAMNINSYLGLLGKTFSITPQEIQSDQ
jgi:cellulose synthase (UDP-forming)